jgi:hypothetical protein
VFLLTDGQAQTGVTVPAEICQCVADPTRFRSLVSPKRHESTSFGSLTETHKDAKGLFSLSGTVNTFGFGAEHNGSLLQKLSTQTGGVYSYIQSTDRDAMGLSFANCLGGLFSVVADNLRITIRPSSPTVAIRSVRTAYPVVTHEPHGYLVKIPDIQSEESKNILVELDVLPQSPTNQSFYTQPLFSVVLEYHDVFTNRDENVKSEATVLRMDQKDAKVEHKRVNGYVNMHVNRMMVAEAISEAISFGNPIKKKFFFLKKKKNFGCGDS